MRNNFHCSKLLFFAGTVDNEIPRVFSQLFLLWFCLTHLKSFFTHNPVFIRSKLDSFAGCLIEDDVIIFILFFPSSPRYSKYVLLLELEHFFHFNFLWSHNSLRLFTVISEVSSSSLTFIYSNSSANYLIVFS